MKDFAARLAALERSLESRMREFRCSVHLCLGQEEAPAALARLLQPEDWVFSTHRSHGHYLAKAVAAGQSFEDAAARLLAEIEGRADGVNGGFSGSQSFCDPALRFHSTAVVGGLIGAATGVALAMKLEEAAFPSGPLPARGISLCCLGDGATEQGVFWEAANFAALHALPVVWLCENNGLSVHAPLRSRQATDLRRRVRAFGLDYYEFRCIDVAFELARKNRTPAFVEVFAERACKHVSAMEDLRE